MRKIAPRLIRVDKRTPTRIAVTITIRRWRMSAVLLVAVLGIGGVGVRLGVKTTGCSGLAYKLEYVDELMRSLAGQVPPHQLVYPLLYGDAVEAALWMERAGGVHRYE